MIYFKKLNEAYVQSGRITLTKYFREGYVHVQGAENIIGDVTDPAKLKLLPDYFANGWAQFMYPAPELSTLNSDKSNLYDKGAYGVGIPAYDTEYLNIPRFKKVVLYYKHDTSATYEVRELVQFDPSAFNPYVDSTTGQTVNAIQFQAQIEAAHFESEQDYYAFLINAGRTMEGYNRNGRMLPPGFTKTAVSELGSYTGEVTLEDGSRQTVRVHVTPMFIQNDRGMFDMVYFENDALVDAHGVTTGKSSLFSGRLLRWYGGQVSQTRAAINYSDDSLTGVSIGQSSNLDGQDSPAVEDQIVIDGVTYINSNNYNLTRKLQ